MPQTIGLQTDRLTLAVIGWAGFNAQKRVADELAQCNGRCHIVGYDLRPPAHNHHDIPRVMVSGNDDLAQRVEALRPTVVWIETPDDCHLDHIRIALDAGARWVLCEKCVGLRVSHMADSLMPVVQAARPQQEVRIIDHYLLLDLVMMLHANAARWLGEVVRMEVTLFEEQGVPPHQERSHADGMTGFFHHVVALAELFFDLNDLVPVQAAWAKHPDANVPDTYRAARLKSKRTGEVVVTGAVGKHMKHSRKLIRVEGTKGKVWIDRDGNDENLIVLGAGGLSVQARRDPDSGYGALVSALANGEILRSAQNDKAADCHAERSGRTLAFAASPNSGILRSAQNDDALPSTLLTVEQALRVLRLVERAHAIAQPLRFYPDGQDVVFGDS